MTDIDGLPEEFILNAKKWRVQLEELGVRPDEIEKTLLSIRSSYIDAFTRVSASGTSSLNPQNALLQADGKFQTEFLNLKAQIKKENVQRFFEELRRYPEPGDLDEAANNMRKYFVSVGTFKDLPDTIKDHIKGMLDTSANFDIMKGLPLDEQGYVIPSSNQNFATLAQNVAVKATSLEQSPLKPPGSLFQNVLQVLDGLGKAHSGNQMGQTLNGWVGKVTALNGTLSVLNMLGNGKQVDVAKMLDDGLVSEDGQRIKGDIEKFLRSSCDKMTETAGPMVDRLESFASGVIPRNLRETAERIRDTVGGQVNRLDLGSVNALIPGDRSGHGAGRSSGRIAG